MSELISSELLEEEDDFDHSCDEETEKITTATMESVRNSNSLDSLTRVCHQHQDDSNHGGDTSIVASHDGI